MFFSKHYWVAFVLRTNRTTIESVQHLADKTNLLLCHTSFVNAFCIPEIDRIYPYITRHWTQEGSSRKSLYYNNILFRISRSCYCKITCTHSTESTVARESPLRRAFLNTTPMSTAELRPSAANVGTDSGSKGGKSNSATPARKSFRFIKQILKQ